MKLPTVKEKERKRLLKHLDTFKIGVHVDSNYPMKIDYPTIIDNRVIFLWRRFQKYLVFDKKSFDIAIDEYIIERNKLLDK